MAIKGYKKISYEDRKIIENLLDNGFNVKEIAEKLHKSRQSIYREIDRCKLCIKYAADYAQFDCIKRNKSKGRLAKLKLDETLAQYISKLILEEFLSPVEIINRLHLENYPDYPLSKATIYSAIDKGLIPFVTRETLQLKRKRTHMFSNGLIKIPQWICKKLDLKDNEDLDIDIIDDKIIIKKSEKTILAKN